MRRLILLASAFAALACAQAQEKEPMDQLIDRVYDVAKVQAVYMDSLLTAKTKMPGQAGHDGEGAGHDGGSVVMAGHDHRLDVMAGCDRPSRYPRTFQGDTLVTSDIGWWCSGFYPGVLWQLYEETDDEALKDLAVKYTLPLAGLLDRETDHDIGFQLMSSFGKMWKYTCPPGSFYSMNELTAYSCEPGDSLFPMMVLARGAEKLAARFNTDIGAIRSWNGARWNYPVIIDNMMNLELLRFWGYPDIADKHAVTTIQNHFREDGTAWHLVNYADDGSVLGKQTVQGYADDTAWARGQAWALYGYAMMASHGPTPLFEKTAWKLARWLMAHLPEDGIPYWDFSQTDYKDASAAAIMAAGFLKLWGVLHENSDNPIDPDDPLLRTAERILRTLASPEYLAEPSTNGGFLLKHGVGNLPGNSEVDVPLTYADYYFLEALSLYPDGRRMEVANSQ